MLCVCVLVHARLCVLEQKRIFLEEFGSAVVEIRLFLSVDSVLQSLKISRKHCKVVLK